MCPDEATMLGVAALGHDLSPQKLLETWCYEYNELPEPVRNAIVALKKAVKEQWGLEIVDPVEDSEDGWVWQMDGWWQPTEQARRLVDAMRERGLVQDIDIHCQGNEP
jgi:hypothetical protein